MKFKENQTEEYYRKLLLLDKVKPFLFLSNIQYIFNQGYCWDILFKNYYVSLLCFCYSKDILKGPFPEGEPYIANNPEFSYWYAVKILNNEFPLGEKGIMDSMYRKPYLEFLVELES